MAEPRTAYLRTGEVAELLAVSRRTVLTWTAKGLLPHTLTFGGHHRYPATEIHRLARALRSELREGGQGG